MTEQIHQASNLLLMSFAVAATVLISNWSAKPMCRKKGKK